MTNKKNFDYFSEMSQDFDSFYICGQYGSDFYPVKDLYDHPVLAPIGRVQLQKNGRLSHSIYCVYEKSRIHHRYLAIIQVDRGLITSIRTREDEISFLVDKISNEVCSIDQSRNFYDFLKINLHPTNPNEFETWLVDQLIFSMDHKFRSRYQRISVFNASSLNNISLEDFVAEDCRLLMYKFKGPNYEDILRFGLQPEQTGPFRGAIEFVESIKYAINLSSSHRYHPVLVCLVSSSNT